MPQHRYRLTAKSTDRIRGSTRELDHAALSLRKQTTLAEQRLWRVLRNKQVGGLRFRRQHPVGRFILDFWCPSHKLVVELDGGIHDEPDHAEGDKVRTEYLAAAGYHVLRFKNEEVITNVESVMRRILAATSLPDATQVS